MRTIWVTVKPRSNKEGILETADGEYLVSVVAPAEGGKANKAVVKVLARHFSVPKSSVTIIHGETGRRKLIELR